MKRLALGVSVLTVAAAIYACGPVKEPKQAADKADTVDETAGASATGGITGSSKPGNAAFTPPPGGSSGAPGKSIKGDAPNVSSLSAFLEGVHFGMSHTEVTKLFTDNGGVIWKDYDEKLAKTRVGPEMSALESEREGEKQAFGRTFIEFKDNPTGYDATGIRGEYSYKNKETLMWISRAGKKRYFFFLNDRMWKVYDEYSLSDSGVWGQSYLDAVNTMNSKVGAQGRVQGADVSKGVFLTTVDYKDNQQHLRVLDRSNEHLVGIAVEDLSTLNNLTQLRANKPEDPNAIDPSVAAVTSSRLSDPNAASTAPSGKKTPKKK